MRLLHIESTETMSAPATTTSRQTGFPTTGPFPSMQVKPSTTTRSFLMVSAR